MSTGSHRRILTSSTVIGSASVINVLIGIVNLKVLAVLLGPPGVALMGLYQNIMNVAATLTGCGLGSSGVRQIAASAGDAATLSIVRRALWIGTCALGLLGMVALWALREPVARTVFGDAQHVGEVGWLGLGVFFTLVSGSQSALLRGLRRIGDLARITIASALAGALAGSLFVFLLGTRGVLFYVLTAPVASYLVARYFVSRLPPAGGGHDWAEVSQQWKTMVRLGAPLMAASVLTLLGQLAARSLLLRDLGVDAAGHFQAAWTVSMTCIGFVLGAMVADYYPRIAASIEDQPTARRLIHEQMEMALLLAGPVLLVIAALSPLIIQLLYTPSFAPAAEVLGWQILGDILKTSTWAMGFAIRAHSRNALVIGTELVWNLVFLGVIWFALKHFGVVAAGIGYFAAYAVHHLVIMAIIGALIGFRPAARNVLATAYLVAAAAATIALRHHGAYWGHAIELVLILVATGYSAYRLNQLLHLRDWVRGRFGK